MNEELYQMYLEEIEHIPACSREENAVMLGAWAAGDAEARNRLVEGNLKAVLAYVKEYEGRGLLVDDLVQEANMALMMAVERYGALAASVAAEHPGMTGRMPEGAFETYIEEKVREALEGAVEEQAREQKAEEEILARVNVLKDISQKLAEELGREATVEELADAMKMTVEEIRDIMKLTLDAMSVPEEES